METHLIFQQQVEALAKDLTLAEQALGSESIRTDLREKVVHLFANVMARQKQQLGRLRDDAAELADGGNLAPAWDRFRALRDDCAKTLRELLAFLEGALVRTARLDDGICDIADHLIRQLGRQAAVEWPRFTIMAEGEFFAGLSEIIRIRYPHCSIWNLPVAAHEFGHYAAPRLKDPLAGTEPYRELRHRIGTQAAAELRPLGPERAEEGAATRRRHLDEIFADLVATHCLGPAWPCTCVLLRFDPRHAYGDGPSHPSDDLRVHLMLTALERFDRQYRPLARNLRQIWRRSVMAAGNADPAETGGEAKDWFTDILDEMIDMLPREAGYREYHRPYDLSKALPSDDWRRRAEGLELRDVLNAAWLARLEDGDGRVDLIGDRALTLCRELTPAGKVA